MRKASNIIVAICGVIGGSVGYWIGYAGGWSNRTDWQVSDGAMFTFLLSVGMAVLFVCVSALVVTWLPAWRVSGVLQNGIRVEGTVVRVEATGEQRQVRGRGGVERQLACELEVCPEGGSPYRARTTQFFTESAQLALQPGAGVVVRYNPDEPERVAIVETVAK
jgi:Protein of unknown function (DUF3592)